MGVYLRVAPRQNVAPRRSTSGQSDSVFIKQIRDAAQRAPEGIRRSLLLDCENWEEYNRIDAELDAAEKAGDDVLYNQILDESQEFFCNLSTGTWR